MFGCFFLDIVISDGLGFREIFNATSELLGTKSSTLDLDTWLGVEVAC